jgi:hypothetical protein
MSDSVPVTVTTQGGSTGPIKIVDDIIGAMGQFNIAIPIAFELVRAIITIFRKNNPDVPLPTDAEVIAALKARAQAALNEDRQWLRDHGFL